MAQSFPVGQAPWETQGGTASAPTSFPVGQAPWETGASTTPTPPETTPATAGQGGISIPTLFPSAPTDTKYSAGAKIIGNLPGSAINTGIGLAKLPIQAASDISKIPSEFSGGASDFGGGIGGTAKMALETAKNVPSAAYQVLAPEAAKGVISAAGGFLHSLLGGNASLENSNKAMGIITKAHNVTDPTEKAKMLAEAGSLIKAGQVAGNAQAEGLATAGKGLQTAQEKITNDPVGQVLPFLLMAREGAYKTSPEAGAAFDSAISKTAAPVVNAGVGVRKLVSGASDVAAGAGKFVVSQATGLFPKTVESITSNPSDFSKAKMATIDRPSVASDVKSALDTRIENLQETGQGYNTFRRSKAPITVDPEYLKNTVESTTGLKVMGDGTAESPYSLKTSGGASIRLPGDVSALQRKIMDVWQPEFAKGYLTPDEFLNFRKDLGDMAKYEGGIGRSSALQNLSDVMRGKFNTQYRDQVPGLAEQDATFSSQISELNNLKNGVLDKNGNLTDAAINRIANATNKGRDMFLSKLEEISPGITQRVKTLKAVEDIENAMGQKVGTYARSLIGKGGALYGLFTGNIPLVVGSIAEMVASSPNLVVPLIRAYGRSFELWGAVVDKLKAGASYINKLPEGAPPLQGVIPTKRKVKSSPSQ